MIARNKLISASALAATFLLAGCGEPVEIPETTAYCTMKADGSTASVVNAFTDTVILTATLTPQSDGTLVADSGNIETGFSLAGVAEFTVDPANKTCTLYNGFGGNVPTYIMKQ